MSYKCGIGLAHCCAIFLLPGWATNWGSGGIGWVGWSSLVMGLLRAPSVLIKGIKSWKRCASDFQYKQSNLQGEVKQEKYPTDSQWVFQ